MGKISYEHRVYESVDMRAYLKLYQNSAKIFSGSNGLNANEVKIVSVICLSFIFLLSKLIKYCLKYH